MLTSATQVNGVYHRTNTNFIIMAVRSSPDDFMRPFYYTTSPKLETFFFQQNKQTISQYSIKVEAFCLSGMPGKYTMSCS